MADNKVKVLTQENLVSQLAKVAEDVLGDWAKDNEFNFANVVLASMIIVEKYNQQIASLEGVDKFEAAKLLIPIIVDQGVKLEKLTEEEGVALKKKLSRSVDLVEQLIEAYVVISKHPQFIQAKDFIVEKTKGCFSLCRKSKTKD